MRREEDRAVDEYTTPWPRIPAAANRLVPPGEDYILGYLQNNPDGSFQTPLVADLRRSYALRPIVAQLRQVTFSIRKSLRRAPPPMRTRPAHGPVLKKEKPAFAERYLSKSQQESKSYLGQKSARTEEITVGQALNLSREDRISGAPNPRQSAAPPAGWKAGTGGAHGSGKRQGRLRRSAPQVAPPRRYAFRRKSPPSIPIYQFRKIFYFQAHCH